MRAFLETIPTGNPGLAVKIKRLRQLVEAAKRDAKFVRSAQAIVQDLPERSHDAEVARVVAFVKDRVRYVRDPIGVEAFTDPRILLEEAKTYRARGDCDDHVILASALLEAIGYPTRYRIGGLGSERWAHIWLQVRIPARGWVSVELVRKDAAIGWETTNFPETLTMSDILPSQRFRAAVLRRALSERGLSDLEPELGKLKLKKLVKAATKLAKAPLKAAKAVHKASMKFAKKSIKATTKLPKKLVGGLKGKKRVGAPSEADYGQPADGGGAQEPSQGAVPEFGPAVEQQGYTLPAPVQQRYVPSSDGGGYSGGGGGGGYSEGNSGVTQRMTGFGPQGDEQQAEEPPQKASWIPLAIGAALVWFAFNSKKKK